MDELTPLPELLLDLDHRRLVHPLHHPKEHAGARIFVDAKSLLYLNGTTLEYEETLMRQGFVFQNPNAARSCGCGSSFPA